MKKVTIKDIATIAGVSRGTVDRVLNGRGNASDQIQKKILKIAKELGYKKNLIASALASNKTYTIIVVLPDPTTDPFWQLPRVGIQKAASLSTMYGISIVYYDYNLFDKETLILQLNNALIAKPDAILMAPTYTSESAEFLESAAKLNIPVITINTEIHHKDVMCYVGQNSLQSGYLAGKLFDMNLSENDEIVAINLGHTVKNAPHYSDKLQGLNNYFKSNPRKKCRIHIYEFENFTDEKKLSKFIDDIIEKHTSLKGIFVTNSRAYRLINAMNVKDAKRFTIIGFDMIEANIRFLYEGQLTFLINQNSVEQGYLGVMAFINHFILKQSVRDKQYLPLDIVVKENAEFYIKMDNV